MLPSLALPHSQPLSRNPLLNPRLSAFPAPKTPLEPRHPPQGTYSALPIDPNNPNNPQNLKSPHGLPHRLIRNPYILTPLAILLLILFITIEIRLLNANILHIERGENWLRRFSKGTSRFRHRNSDKKGVPGEEVGNLFTGKGKSKRKHKIWMRNPGFMVKNALTTTNDWVVGAVRTAVQDRDVGGMTIRGFDGKPISPVAIRPWAPSFDTILCLEGNDTGLQRPPSPTPTMTAASPYSIPSTTAKASRVSYGVPPAIKPVRARKPTVAQMEMIPEAPAKAQPISVVRQQLMEEEGSTGLRNHADAMVLGQPRGEDGQEEKDLEQGIRERRR